MLSEDTDFPYPHHVVRADHPGALYQENPSGRLSVVVPLDLQQTGSDYSLILLRFMCLGSCVGGISRRPITIVLTLENGQADVLGRKVIDVRVCACPTRDIRTDEQSVSNRGVKRKGSSTQSHPVMKKIPRLVEPKLDLDESFQEVFNIKVHGRQLYTFLCSMKREYYNSHPDYALRYPDPSITGNRQGTPLGFSIRQKNTSNVKEKMNRAEIYEENSNVGKSAGSSPVHDGNLVIDAQDSPPHGSTASHLQPPPDCLASTMSLVLMNRDTNGMDSINAHHLAMKAASVPQHLNVTTSIPVFSSQTLSNTKMVPVIPSLASFRSQLTTTQSDSAAFPNGRLPGHVPVMQVRREAPLRRMHSEPKVSGGRQPLAYRKNHNVINMRPMATAGVVLGLDTAGREGDNSSHDSEEILAANVLAQGFAKKSRK
ncbi:Cellular tumor antigen p53 [Chionoecetes opilio]|uniref:Cellular tumor antigen p53 n=1 Tax=Chionoecetes opilio TaxID=41210 RepID=A0A8J4YEJ4_CHIOP|nr:Cellular tumor antigen p53 [Chionoecetes opilio]